MSEAANGASRHHMKDADKLRDRNFLFLLSALRGGGPVLQACLHVWKPNAGFSLRGWPTHPNAIFNKDSQPWQSICADWVVDGCV